MLILLLENEPEIKERYLGYLNTKDNKIVKIWDKYDEEKVDVIVIRSNIDVNNSMLDRYKNLKHICRVGVWLDKIDIKECMKRWIEIYNTPWANADSVADLVLSWTLNLSRNIRGIFDGIENRFSYMWRELNQRIVGIFWFWNIWKKVYERLKWFGVKNFLIYDPFLKKSDVEKFEFCSYVEDKKEIFKKCDLITFHIPLLDSTRNFLWKKEFKLLSNDTLIINTSRGWIINENKLIEFLSEHPESWAFLDVWEEEPNDPKIELLELENCMITPHIWAMTQEAEKNMHYFKELVR